MTHFTLPEKEALSDENKAIYDNLIETLGKVPNIYAAFARSKNGLKNYIALQNGKSSLSNREKEVINLVVSQVNHCPYCLRAHTAIAKLNGFTDHQILEIRGVDLSFDDKLNALAKLAHNIALSKGRVEDFILEDFYEAGYNEGNLIDVVMAVGDKMIMNFMYALTNVPIDWPLAPSVKDVSVKDNRP